MWRVPLCAGAPGVLVGVGVAGVLWREWVWAGGRLVGGGCGRPSCEGWVVWAGVQPQGSQHDSPPT